jgi:hypothetical protein
MENDPIHKSELSTWTQVFVKADAECQELSQIGLHIQGISTLLILDTTALANNDLYTSVEI